jgi:16S rRNA (guanine527-N7)-methyltransferase
LIDIGTGAGLPGIPLKIVLSDWHVTLLEATGKKVDFLNHVIAQLDLVNTFAIHIRAEDAGQQPAYREKFDVAVARAVAQMATLVEYALPLVRLGGWFIAQKGVDIDDELQHAARALDELGGRVRQIVPVQLPGLDKRHLIVVEKIAPTPVKYPRRAGLPERKPLIK